LKYYAGIGARETPAEVLELMTAIAQKLSKFSYSLRSGGAEGADTAFEWGAIDKQIFLPWDGFNGKYTDGSSYIIPPLNTELVRQFHPSANNLSQGALKLMSRNSYQVLGANLDDPVSFVLCWTKDGKLKGGTAQAIRLATHYNIPVFNLGSNGLERFSKHMMQSIG